MSDLIAAIGVLYACNLLTERGPVTADLALQCVRAHEAVKFQFLTADEVDQLSHVPFREQYAIKLRGYRRFTAWEGDHPDLVRQIRDTQRERLGSIEWVPVN